MTRLNQFELKLHGNSKYFIERYDAIHDRLFIKRHREESRQSVIGMLITFLDHICELVVLIVCSRDIVGRLCGVGDLTYYLGLVSSFRDVSTGLANQISSFLTNDTRLTRLREFIKLETETEQSGSLEMPEDPTI